MTIKRDNRYVNIAVIVNQLAMLGNIAVGVIILPFILSRFGEESLVLYIKVFAVKAVVDIFTSAVGGGFIKEMIENGVKEATKMSAVFFGCYSVVVIVAVSGMSIYSYSYNYLEVTAFLGFIVFALIQQPLHQRLSAAGYQYIPALIRLFNNTLLFITIVAVGMFVETPVFLYILWCLASASLLTFVVACVITVCLKIKSTADAKPSYFRFIKKTMVGYSAFAALLALCFQIEILMLEAYVSQSLFLLLIVAWKVPNLMAQFIWRYAEANGLQIKRVSKNNDKVESIRQLNKVASKTLLVGCLAAALFLLFGSIGYNLWMGEVFGSQISWPLIICFTVGIVALSVNRVYTALLQYTDQVIYLALQYLVIILVKVVCIMVLVPEFYLASFIVWFAFEILFIFVNKRLARHELLSA